MIRYREINPFILENSIITIKNSKCFTWTEKDFIEIIFYKLDKNNMFFLKKTVYVLGLS